MTNCPICGKTVDTTVGELLFCQECSITFDPVRTPTSYYRGRCANYIPGIRNDFDRHIAVADRLVPYFTPGIRILDIGCATGELPIELRSRGFPVTVHEVNEDCLEYLRAQGFPLLEAGQKFDFIILQHVLEHIDDLRRMKAFVDSLAAPNALVYIETPNRRQYAKYPKAVYSNREHINNFDLFSIRRLFCDWSVVDFGESAAIRDTLAVVWCILSRRSHEGDYEEIYTRNIERMLYECGEPFAIWGAGEMADKLLARYKPEVSLIVDTHKAGGTIQGRPIRPPEDLRSYSGALMICSSDKQYEIQEAAEKLGFSGKVVMI